MLERTNRITVDRLARDMAMAGMIRYLALCQNRAQPVPRKVAEPKPEVGSQRSFRAKI